MAFDAWKEGHVAPTHHDVPVVAPAHALHLEPVSARLKRELIHPDRSDFLVSARFSADGTRLIASDYPGGVVVIWDVASGKQLRAIETGSGSHSSWDYFFVTPDWQTLFVPQRKRQAERVEQDGRRLTRWTFDGAVRAWDLTSGRLRRTYQHQPPRNILAMEFAPDGTRFITFDELPGIYEGPPRKAASLWDVATGQYRTLPDGLESSGFSPDGRTVAMTAVGEHGYAKALKLFDGATGQEKLSIPIQDKNVWAYARTFSPNGRLLVGTYRVFERPQEWDTCQSWLKWWDTATGAEIASFAADKDDAFGWLKFSADGQSLTAASRRGSVAKLLLFHVPNRRLAWAVPLAEKREGESVIMSCPAFSPDGRWLAITTQVLPDAPGSVELDIRDLPQPRIHLIDVAAGVLRETLVAPQGYAHGLCCFSPDGRTLATGGYGRVLLWDLTKPPGETSHASRGR